MKRARTTISMAALLLMAAIYESGAEPLATMDEVGSAIQACWNPPAGTSGSAVTLSFSFNRDGKLIGPPMPTAINVPGDETARQAFVDATTKALQGCMPLSFSPALAVGIGGTVFTMEFASPAN